MGGILAGTQKFRNTAEVILDAWGYGCNSCKKAVIPRIYITLAGNRQEGQQEGYRQENETLGIHKYR